MTTPLGKFVWYEYMGSDLKAAAEYYSHVVGWTAKDSGMPGMDYTIVSAGTTMVAGMMNIPADAKAMGARPSWLGYIWVENVDASAKEAEDAGGKIYKPGADIPGVGRFAVVADPYGAAFCLFRDAGGNPPPPPPPNTPGLVGWHELYAGDGAAAFAFYSKLVGWQKTSAMDMGAMGTYQMFGPSADVVLGGMMTKTPQTPASFWLFYFNVDGIDAAIERVKAKGGQIANGPMEVPGGQWIVQAIDPQGAMFALVAPKR